jgi:hypothetical protein
MGRTGLRVLSRVPAALCVLAIGAGPAFAQRADATPPGPNQIDVSRLRMDAGANDPQATPTPRPATTAHHVLAWTVEVHGGYFGAWAPPDGFGAVPAGGADFVTTSDVVSPAANSWYFGRGAAWLNHYAKPVSSSLQISPLDPLLTTASALRQHGGAFGVRVTREINQRLDLELVADRVDTQFVVAPGVISSLQSTSSSFVAVWQQLLQALPASSATSQLGGTVQYGHRTVATAAIDYFISFGRVTPYVSVGGGVAANSGSVDATLSGDMAFQVNTFAEHQTDSVDIVFGEKRWEPVAVLGMGLVGHLTKRIGWRMDLRDYLIASGLRTTVSATPGAASGSGVTDLINANGDAIQFNPATTPASTLGVPVSNATTFTGTGWHKQLSASFGVFYRF